MVRIFAILLMAIGMASVLIFRGDLFGEWCNQKPTKLTFPAPKIDLGEPLYPAEALEPLTPAFGMVPRQVVVDPCHLVARFKQDISSPKDGQLLFVGRELTKEDPLKQANRPVDTAFIFQGDKKVPRFFQQWNEGDIVEEGQMVALIDPALALN
jgi:hypothetical protein